MIFTNAFDRTLDAKSRLQIPSQVREVLHQGDAGNVLYIVPGFSSGTLALYPEAEFTRMSDGMDKNPIPDSDSYVYQHVFYSLAVRQEMDRQGRVAMPDRLLKRADLGQSVVLTGAGSHLEVWNKSDYETFIDKQWRQWPEVQRSARAAANRKSE